MVSMSNFSFKRSLIEMQNELQRFANKVTSHKEDTDVLSEETSLKVLDNEGKYQPESNFKGWMYAMIRHIFIDNYHRILKEQPFVEDTGILYHLNPPQDSDFITQGSAYDLKEMRRVVNSMPSEYTLPFSMHSSGFNCREIAERLKLPLGTVKSRISFTHQKLQQELNKTI